MKAARWRLFAIAFLTVAATKGPTFESGSRLKIRGHFEGQRVVAESVRLKDASDDDAEIVGRVEAKDENGRFRIHGIWVSIDEGEVSRRGRRWVRRLEPGDWAKVEGHWMNTGDLLADAVGPPARDRRSDALEGLVVDTRADLITIGPFAIEITEQTEWRGFE